MELLVVLVGSADHEGLDEQAVVADHQHRRRDELVLAGQAYDERPSARSRSWSTPHSARADATASAASSDGRSSRHGERLHRRRAGPRAAPPAIASTYTSSTAAAVDGQPNACTCLRGAFRQPLPARRVRQHRAEHARPAAGVVALDQDAADPVGDRRPETADRGGDDRGAARLSLEGDQAEGLAVRRAPRRCRRRGRRARARPAPWGGRTVRRRRSRAGRPARARCAGLARPVPLGPPTTCTTSRARSSGRDASSRATDAQQDLGSLERLDPADEHQHQGVGGKPEHGPATRYGCPG